MHPWVSCIIPVRNDGATLGRAVASVLQQIVPLELIIVDDASTEDTSAIARHLAQCHDCVRLVEQKVNRGPAASRNAGAALAIADYICFLDADDEHLPDFYALACKLLDEYEGWAGVKGGLEFRGLPPDCSLDAGDPRYQKVRFSYPGNLLLRAEVFHALNGFPEDDQFRRRGGGEDVAFMTAFSRNFVYFDADRPVCRYYDRPDSHLRRYLERTRVVEGRVEYVELLAEERDGGLERALARYLQSLDTARIRAMECALLSP